MSRPSRVVLFRSSVLPALVAATLLTVPCEAQAQADPVGHYTYTAQVEGRSMTGVIELGRGGDGILTGQLRLGPLPPAEITGGTWRTPVLSLEIRLPEGPAEATLTISGDGSFTGQIRLGTNVIQMRGSKDRDSPAGPSVGFIEAIRPQVEKAAPIALAEEGEAGLVVAAVEGASTWVEGFGSTARSGGRPVDGTTVYQVGSLSKLVTAWGVMRLVDEGRLGLDIPVNDYLERWKVPDGEFDASGVTVRRLLSHTAGINVPSISGVDVGEPVPDLVAELQGRGRGADWQVRVVQEPGGGFLYSGGGYMILQLLVEEVTGRTFADYMSEEVLHPLGMDGSSFTWDDAVAARVATPQSDEAERSGRHRLFTGVAGAGLYTTVDDMARLMEAHLPGADGEPAGRGVVAPATLRLMLTPDVVAGAYGLGYEVYPMPGGRIAVGHSGSNVGWKANLILVPDRRVGFAVLTNEDAGRARARIVGIVRDILPRIGG